jgi:hypothetical protein
MEAAQAITVAAAAALITVGVPACLLVVALRGGLIASWTAGAAIIAACGLVGAPMLVLLAVLLLRRAHKLGHGRGATTWVTVALCALGVWPCVAVLAWVVAAAVRE